jgi:cytochrome c peroxidase
MRFSSGTCHSTIFLFCSMQFLFISQLAIADQPKGSNKQQPKQTSGRQNFTNKGSVSRPRQSVPIETQAVRTTSKSRSRQKRLDKTLERLLRKNDVQQIEIPIQNQEHVALGQNLFFDRILSGNYDTACATCHHPLTNTSDDLALGLGTGVENPGAIGPFRIRGEGRTFVPRNSPHLFNLGSERWHTIYWDGRIETTGGIVTSPAGPQLPLELTTPLQIQAMFPVTSRVEMRGSLEDAQLGNEIAAIDNTDFIGIWSALMDRLLEIEEYRRLFKAAFPSIPESSLGFQHAAIAIAAFEADAFGVLDSPFDRYVAGDRSALDADQKRGAILFYSSAKCSVCHSGTLMSDQKHHNLAVPQLGPGKSSIEGLDLGRFEWSGRDTDRYKFRTPSLRNVNQTGPWMHNGAFSNLADVIYHHLEPKRAVERDEVTPQLYQVDLRSTVVKDRYVNREMLETVSLPKYDLNQDEIGLLLRFLDSLTSDDLQARLSRVIPSSVPSGLLEDGFLGNQ